MEAVLEQRSKTDHRHHRSEVLEKAIISNLAKGLKRKEICPPTAAFEDGVPTSSSKGPGEGITLEDC